MWILKKNASSWSQSRNTFLGKKRTLPPYADRLSISASLATYAGALSLSCVGKEHKEPRAFCARKSLFRRRRVTMAFRIWRRENESFVSAHLLSLCYIILFTTLRITPKKRNCVKQRHHGSISSLLLLCDACEICTSTPKKSWGGKTLRRTRTWIQFLVIRDKSKKFMFRNIDLNKNINQIVQLK